VKQGMRQGGMAPAWGLRAPRARRGVVTVLVAACVCALLTPAVAQPEKKPDKAAPTAKDDPSKGKGKDKDDKKSAKDQVFNFEGLGLAGKNRSPQLLYFLERANEELERASLQKRSFIPHIVRSVEEEQL